MKEKFIQFLKDNNITYVEIYDDYIVFFTVVNAEGTDVDQIDINKEIEK